MTEILILSILCIVVILEILLLIVSSRKRDISSITSEDIQRIVATENDRMKLELDRAVINIKEVEKETKLSVEAGLQAINISHREQMRLFFEKLSQLGEGENARHLSMMRSLNEQMKDIRDSNERALKEIAIKNEALALQIKEDMEKIRSSNEKKLEEMRVTVDERLQQSLDERITKAFKEVTENLTNLYQSLGKLNMLTEDVRNINKLFSNVKTRGVWGELQAEAILSDILTPDQYEKDYSPKNNRERVEFAIRLPGKEGEGCVYLPIDSKFPTADYIKYKDAIESHNEAEINLAIKQLKDRVVKEAKDIKSKYIAPPVTTDFAILFLPAESIYAELLRIDGLVDKLQNEERVVITGPNNFAALLNSLRLGFKTFQIEQYTSQIWKNFEVLKKYFLDISKAIDESKKAVGKASEQLDSATRKKERLSSVLLSIEKDAEKASFAPQIEYIDVENE